MAVPFFMLAGEIMNKGGLSKRIVNVALALVGHVQAADWAMSTILAVCVLASLSGLRRCRRCGAGGTAGADDGRGRPQQGIRGGLVAAGGIIGPVIPPEHRFRHLRSGRGCVDLQAVPGGILPGFMLGVGLCARLVVGRAQGEHHPPPRKSLAVEILAIVRRRSGR